MTERERGQATVLAVGLALVVFAVCGLAVDGTRAFLLRRTLQNAADGAALAAASEIDRMAFYDAGGTSVRVHEAAARRLVGLMLSRRGVTARVGVEVTPGAVTVVLADSAPTTFLQLLGIDAVPVAARSRAVPVPGVPG